MEDSKTTDTITFKAIQIKPNTILPTITTLPARLTNSIDYKNTLYLQLSDLIKLFSNPITPRTILDTALSLNVPIYFNDSTELPHLYIKQDAAHEVRCEILNNIKQAEAAAEAAAIAATTVEVTLDKPKTTPTPESKKPKTKTTDFQPSSVGYEYHDGVKTIMIDNCEYVSVRSWALKYDVSPDRLLSWINRTDHVGFFQKPWREKFVLKSDVVKAFEKIKSWDTSSPIQQSPKTDKESVKIKSIITETTPADSQEDDFYANVYTSTLDGEEYVGVSSLADFCKLNSSSPLKTIIKRLDIDTVFEGVVYSNRGRNYISKKDAITVVKELMQDYKISRAAKKWLSYHNRKDKDKTRATKTATRGKKTIKQDKTDTLVDVMNSLRETLDQLVKTIK